MEKIINVADLKNPETGKTWREENLELTHEYPIDSLVEDTETGIRLFVVDHTRDCDGTPLYSLSFKKKEELPEKVEFQTPAADITDVFLRGHQCGLLSGMKWSGLPGECLVLIRKPD